MCTPGPALRRQRSLRALERPAFDTCMELVTPPASDAEGCSPEPGASGSGGNSTAHVIITPLTRKKSAPCIRSLAGQQESTSQQRPQSDSSPGKADHASIHNVETLLLVLKTLSTQTNMRMTVREFARTMELMAPHLVPHLMEQEIPMSESMSLAAGKQGTKVTLERQVRHFIMKDFSAMIRVEDKAMFLLLTSQQVRSAVSTVEEVLDSKVSDFVRGLLSRQISRSIFLKDLHDQLKRFYPYATSCKFMTASALKEFLAQNGFCSDVNGVVRVYQKPLRRPNLPLHHPRSSHEDTDQEEAANVSTGDQITPDSSPEKEPSVAKTNLVRKSVSFSGSRKSSLVTGANTDTTAAANAIITSDGRSIRDEGLLSQGAKHGDGCLCGKVDFVRQARRLPPSRLKAIWGQRYDCLIHQFAIFVNKDQRQTAADRAAVDI